MLRPGARQVPPRQQGGRPFVAGENAVRRIRTRICTHVNSGRTVSQASIIEGDCIVRVQINGFGQVCDRTIILGTL